MVLKNVTDIARRDVLPPCEGLRGVLVGGRGAVRRPWHVRVLWYRGRGGKRAHGLFLGVGSTLFWEVFGIASECRWLV